MMRTSPSLRLLEPVDAAALNSLSMLAPRDELLAAAAHELRLPLTHIKGFLSTLRRTDVEWDEATRGDFLAEIEAETDRLASLVSKLLDTSASRQTEIASAPDRTTADPAALVRGGLHRVRGFVGGRVVRVDVPDWLPSVRVDVDAIERLLANLLQNAARYSPPHGQIHISAQVLDLGTLELTIDDEGPGVPIHLRKRIFEPFFRHRSDVPGHGLGLAICRAIVRAHGGTIEVGDSPGGGARFSVRLPIEIANPGTP